MRTLLPSSWHSTTLPRNAKRLRRNSSSPSHNLEQPLKTSPKAKINRRKEKNMKKTIKIQRAKNDTPFRPEGLPSELMGFVSLLQRAKVRDLHTRESISYPHPVLCFSLQRHQLEVFPQRYFGATFRYSIWDKRAKDWVAQTIKVEDLFPLFHSLLEGSTLLREITFTIRF